MNKFDKKIKEMSREMQVPASYDQKVDELLQTLVEKEKLPQRHKGRKRILQLAVCLFCVLILLSFYTFNVHANIFTFFKETIIDFLMGDSKEDPEDMGIGSDQAYVGSKPDLIMELTEKVIDSHSFYLLVTITAPTNVQFADNITFDYFCFCKGINYNVDQLIGGAISCDLLEVSEDMPNRATYVVSLVFDEDLEEGTDITVCFQDLTADPYTDHPTLLVGGVWSMTFPLYHTVTENLKIEGSPDMTFPYINTTAQVVSMELTPLGMVLVADISNFPADELGLSDTSIAIRLKMIDGSELVLGSHDPGERKYVDSSSSAFREENGKVYQQDTIEFDNAIHIDKILGIYIEDLYIPFKSDTL